MTDIVERLREHQTASHFLKVGDLVAELTAKNEEAADEIERLRALLRKAKDRLYDTGCWDEADEIIAALGEDK